MDRGWWTKIGIILAVTLGCVWLLVPSYYSFFVLPREQRNDLNALEQRLPGWAPPARYRLNLGLELQGGVHMVMRVDTKTALQKRVERSASQIQEYLASKKLEVMAVARPDKLAIAVTPKDPATFDAVENEALSAYGEDFSSGGREEGAFILQLNDTRLLQFEEQALEQAMIVIRRRIDKWGVAEADIRKRGNDAIQISLPGAEDPERAKELIGRTAQLEFRMVDDGNFFADLFTQSPPAAESGITQVLDDGFAQLQAPDRAALLAYVEGKAPEGKEVLLECIASQVKKDECTAYKTYLVETHAGVTGDSLTAADATLGQFNEPEVNLQFNAQGARDFERLTEENVNERMAIVLDDTVHSAPRINEKIPGGRARITLGAMGSRSRNEQLQEASDLALVLRTGALPAPVTTGEIRQVGALLGPELIRKGALAALVGMAAVVFFMALYYRRSGMIADLALILNGMMILAALAAFNATLTLPGIAGFVLTLGIAVDANVLINERIREELRNGKTARAAVDQGYDRAFWTIFDAHVTALIAGFVLFATGTGPVRGFATALVVGLIASLFTSIVVTRAITTYFVHGRNASTVSV